MWIVNDATIDGSETGTSFRQALQFMEMGFNLHDTMIWCKSGGGAVGSQLCYTQNFEYMFVFSKGHPKTANLICDMPNISAGKTMKCGHRRGDKPTSIRNRDIIGKDFSRRNNWWYLVPQEEEGSKFHPAIFPEVLVRDHIKSWSNEGDLVLDPFMGSGTTAKVARALNRNYIGFEISQEYVDKANLRLQQTKTLFDY